MSNEAMKLALEALESSRGLLEIEVNKAIERDAADAWIREKEAELRHHDAAIKALEEALAKQEQKRPQNCGTSYCSCIECVMDEQEQGEPVATPQAIYNKVCLGLAEAGCKLSEQQKMALASLVQDTTPQQRTWVGLTDDEVVQIRNDMTLYIRSHVDFYKHCEAKLKEKNT